jgi:hypothetical protein
MYLYKIIHNGEVRESCQKGVSVYLHNRRNSDMYACQKGVISCSTKRYTQLHSGVSKVSKAVPLHVMEALGGEEV